MSDTKRRRVVILVGSLRKDSLSAALAMALREVAPTQLALDIVGIGEMPFYNSDDEENPPGAWLAFRDEIATADAVLFITPEYNRSVPAVLKNAIDVGSRPYGKSVWNGKPAGVISLSPGALGGFGANHHLRQSLACLNVPILPAPEAYLGGAAKLLNERGSVASDETRHFLTGYMESLLAWTDKHSSR